MHTAFPVCEIKPNCSRYCNRIHRQESASVQANEVLSEDTEETTPSVYHTLLSLYLQPPSPNKPLLAPALDLLSKHGSRLPATSSLGLIPDDLPIHELDAYFRGRIRSVNSLVNESRIVASLRKAEGISVAAELHIGDGTPGGQGGRNRHITITDERHCFVCHKKLRLGMRMGGSVVAVLPDNTVVHQGCLSRATGGRPTTPSWGRSP